MEFKCECCKYTTTKRFNYDKHLASNKHTMLEESSKKFIKLESTQKQPIDTKKVADFKCKHCSQTFKFKQSMHRHINHSCSKNKEQELKQMIHLLKIQIEQQRQEFIKIMDAQSEQIEKLRYSLEIHDSFNTVNHIQHIHLKVIRENEDSPFSDSELKSLFVKFSE